jgi:hypothetical protein
MSENKGSKASELLRRMLPIQRSSLMKIFENEGYPMQHVMAKLMLYKQPFRVKFFKELIKRLRLFPYETRVKYSAIERPHYGYCVLQAAKLAQRLGHRKISVIEFGVAGGNGLLNLEMHAAKAEELTGVVIQIFGFDTGGGLPAPTDYRDLPYQWKQGFFEMDIDKLKARMSRSTLVIGNIADTLPLFVERYQPAPIGALFMDLDYYSSTKHAFTLFDLHRANILPRTFMYFDDVTGDEVTLYNEYTGVRLAINEFNDGHANQKICKNTYLGAVPSPEIWHDNVYIYHDYSSSEYNKFVAHSEQQLPLGSSA